MDDLEEIAKECGFESAQEMHQMVCGVNLTNPVKEWEFTKWKLEDGTKTGLQKIIDL